MLSSLVVILATATAAFGTRFVIQLQDNIALNSILHDQSYQPISDSFSIGSFRAFTGDFAPSTLKSMYTDPRVSIISRDRNLKLQDMTLQHGAPSHLEALSSISKSSHQPFIYNSVSGNGVDVYVLDTGIDMKHPNLSKLNVLKMADLTDSPVPQGTDPHGHGTALAGLIGSETFGVIKKCNLIDVRVADSNGTAKLSTILQALALIHTHITSTRRPSVIVIPFGMEDGGSNPILTHAIANLHHTVSIVIAAGNNAQDARNLSPANINPKPLNVIVVGSLDRNEKPADFTNYGSNVDIFTSGEDLTTLQSTDSQSSDFQLTEYSLTRQISGTSASSAIAAGAIGYYMSLGFNSTESINRVLQYSRCVGSDSAGHCARILQLQP